MHVELLATTPAVQRMDSPELPRNEYGRQTPPNTENLAQECLEVCALFSIPIE